MNWLKHFSSVATPTPTFSHVPAMVLLNPCAWFRGKLCKLCFASQDGAVVERLWVLCYGVAQDERTLMGTLNEAPSEAMEVKQGETVRFMRDEIIDLQDMPK